MAWRTEEVNFMARMRSPNFPSLSLEEALSFAKVIWDKNRKAPIMREAAAKDLGYTGLTGRSMTVLGALNQYGLVELSSKGRTRVTQLTEDILVGYPEEVKRSAIATAGRMPGLFRDIYDKFEGVVPGENAVRSFLFQKGFTNEGVEKALKSFSATNRYVEINGDSESYRNDDEAAPKLAPEREMEPMPSTPQPQGRSPSQQPVDPLFWPGGPLDFSLSSHGLAVVGKTNSAKELKAFIEKLKTLLALLPEAPKDEPDAAAE
jgi:hypothetical protein